MFAEIRQTIEQNRGKITGWSIGLALYGIMMAALYPTIQEIEGLQELIESYPQEMLAFLGNITEIATPSGYLGTYYFLYMTMIIGILTIGMGAGLIAGDEEEGTLDLILAHPVSRAGLFWGRYIGFVITTIIVLFVSWLSWVIPSGYVEMELTWIEFLRPFLSLFAQLMLFGTLALFLSMVLPASRTAGMLSGALLVGNFLIDGLSNINEDLESIVKFTPLHYYQSGDAIAGLNWTWLAGLFAAIAALTVAAWLIFERRDIRVGGERSWNLSRLFRRGGKEAAKET